HLALNEIENAAARLAALRALIRRSADAEQLLEGDAWIANDRQRFRRRCPADRIRVDARIAICAPARLIDRLDAELHRRNGRVLAEALRVQLVERLADVNVRAFCLLRMRLRQVHRARPEMVAADLFRARRL